VKVLVITNLYPNSQEATRGTYNSQQCQGLSKLCDIKIVAPLPWSPMSTVFKRGAVFAKVPEHEIVDGLEVYHPRYFMVPKIGRSFYGFFFYLSLLGKIRNINKAFDFDVVYAPWVYPDGVGSQLIAKVLNKPVVIGALGTDINVYLKYFLRRKIIVRSLSKANGVVAVSNALKEKMVKNGVSEGKITVIPNGVNTRYFRLLDKAQCRKDLNIDLKTKVILFVGNLVPIKGVEDLLDAIVEIKTKLSELKLIIVGDGPLKDRLKQKVENLMIRSLFG
jgi:teichuronic acid biosynthesis glycosyltransferase TuaC